MSTGSTSGWAPDPTKSESFFSSLRTVASAVPDSAGLVPGCCLRTALTLQQAQPHGVRALQLPITGSLPHESLTRPPGNRLRHVMKAAVAPVLQVTSGHASQPARVAEVTLSARGPQECPPGTAHRVVISGHGGSAQTIPCPAWAWGTPALLDPSILAGPALPALLHPLHMPDLEPQVWRISVPACGPSDQRLVAHVQAYPDLRWQGRLRISTEPTTSHRRGYIMKIDSTLTVSYGDSVRPIDTWEDAVALCPPFAAVELLARSAATLDALVPSRKNQGLDNPQLVREADFTWSPWPALTLTVDAALVPMPQSGLLGHALTWQVEGPSFMGATGGRSLLPIWLEGEPWRRRLAPLLINLGTTRTEDICQECGVWLRGEGTTGLTASLHVERPTHAVGAAGKSHGTVELWLEGRSAQEAEGVLLRSAASTTHADTASITVHCVPPPPTPLPDPRQHLFKMRTSCHGLAFHSIEKWAPGVRLRAWTSPEDPPSTPAEILPPRHWPAAGEPGTPVPIPIPFAPA